MQNRARESKIIGANIGNAREEEEDCVSRLHRYPCANLGVDGQEDIRSKRRVRQGQNVCRIAKGLKLNGEDQGCG